MILLLFLVLAYTSITSQKPATIINTKTTTKTARGKLCSNMWFMCRSEGVAVCGSDNRTYANLCHLNQQQCHNTALQVLHNGRCTVPTTSPNRNTDITPTTAKLPQECEERCGWTYRPVCGSNGVVYRNLCWIEHARRCYDTTIKVLNTGFCGNCGDLCTRMQPRPMWLVCPIHQANCQW